MGLSTQEIRKMIKRLSSVMALVALIASFVAIPATTASAQNGRSIINRLEVPIAGVVQSGGTMTGTFSISRFAIVNGTLMAMGQLNGTVTDGTGAVVRTIVTNTSWPVATAGSGDAAADAAASCDSASSA